MNKCLLLIFSSLFYTLNLCATKLLNENYLSKYRNLGGDIIIKSSSVDSYDDNVAITFEIEAPVSGEYYINFWMFPAYDKNGEYISYDISINEKLIDAKLIPSQSDWHSATLVDNKKYI